MTALSENELDRLEALLDSEFLGGEAMLLDENPQLQPVLPASWWQEHNVQLHLGVTLREIDRASRTLTLTDGQTYRWSQLLLATGAAARPLPLLDKLGERCFTLRHAGDAERLRDVLQPGKAIAIVGAGTIGLELAASATPRGCQVAVVEMASSVMGRNAPAPVRDYLLARHQQAGVRVLLNSSIEHAEAGEFLSLTLQNGETLLADAVIYGIGIVANDALARDAGLEAANGIIVDTACSTADPAIFAAGDVAQHHQYGLCIQSWAFAQNQAIATAKAMLDPQASGYDEAPWLWSDQYDRNIQILGIPQAGSRTIVRDEPQGAIYFSLNADGRLTQLVAFNNARIVKLAKRWMAAGRDLSNVPLADPTFSLMSLR